MIVLRKLVGQTAIYGLSSIVYCPFAQAQSDLVGRYADGTGQTFDLHPDSTFEYNYYFDVIHDRACGRWTVTGGTVHLEYVSAVDTFITVDTFRVVIAGRDVRYPMEQRTLIQSNSCTSRSFKGVPPEGLVGPGSGIRPKFLLNKGNALYPSDAEGKRLYRKHPKTGTGLFAKRAGMYFVKLREPVVQ